VLYFVLGLVLLIALLYQVGLVGRSHTGRDPSSAHQDDEYPYYTRKYLLTKAERSLYEVLRLVLGDYNVVLFTQIRLADLIKVRGGTKHRQAHFNRIQSKHVDFVVCEKEYLQPLMAIELDDSSHSRSRRVARDSFVDNALTAAGLPLLRVKAQRTYSVKALAEQLETILGPVGQAAVTREHNSE